MRRRKRISKIIAVGIIIFIICVLVCGSLSIKEEAKEREYILGNGETLWELYEEYGRETKWSRWHSEMMKVNGKEFGDVWKYGEEITLLLYE